MNDVRERHLKTLETLAVYKYLTVSQFIDIGVKTHKQNMNEILLELQRGKRPLIGCIKFGVLPKIGRLSYVYYLTKQGVTFIIDNLDLTLDQINYPIGTATFFTRDYFHRIACVNFQVAFRKWAESKDLTIDFYYNYYDKTGSNRKEGGIKSRVKTKIDLKQEKYIIPDSVCQFSKENKKVLFLFEQHNGKNTKKFINQLLQHAIALYEKSVQKQYKVQKDSRVYCVFEFPSIMQAVMMRVASDKAFAPFKDHFLFKTAATVKQDFPHGWRTFDARVVDFLGRKEGRR